MCDQIVGSELDRRDYAFVHFVFLVWILYFDCGFVEALFLLTAVIVIIGFHVIRSVNLLIDYE